LHWIAHTHTHKRFALHRPGPPTFNRLQDKCSPLFQLYSFLTSALPLGLNGPFSENAPTPTDEQPGPTFTCIGIRTSPQDSIVGIGTESSQRGGKSNADADKNPVTFFLIYSSCFLQFYLHYLTAKVSFLQNRLELLTMSNRNRNPHFYLSPFYKRKSSFLLSKFVWSRVRTGNKLKYFATGAIYPIAWFLIFFLPHQPRFSKKKSIPEYRIKI
jgi:hypothetical protein